MQGVLKKDSVENPLVTVITVVYNGESFLEETIKSVISQTYSNVEYIVVDGGSTDKTLSIIRKYSHAIDYWISEPDNGIYDAMNKGIGFSRGSFVSILNSDDYYFKDTALEEIMEMSSNAAIAGNTHILDECSGKLSIFEGLKGKLNIQIPFMHPAFLVKKEVYERIGCFDRRYKVAADCDFIMRVYSCEDIYISDIDFVVMRSGGVSDSSFVKGRMEYFTCYLRNTKDFPGALLGLVYTVSLFYLGRLKRAVWKA